ncbi:MAG: peptide chain release factor N(5)-glutamine methyltransferase [Azonexus sp.]|jgi:release factor glutamine methyltransferase|nr:peptide chain release factor N(5)-glutamine methyltransferase [Azonexus sp.]
MRRDEALNWARQRIDRQDARLLLQYAAACRHADLLAHPETPLDAVAWQRFIGWVERRAKGEPLAYLVGETEFRGRVFQVSPAVLIPRPDTEVLVEQALIRLQIARSASLDTPLSLDGRGSPHPRPLSHEGEGRQIPPLSRLRERGRERGFGGEGEGRAGALAKPRPLSPTPLPRGERGLEGTPALLDLGTGSGIVAISLALECPAASVTAIDLSPVALAVAAANAGRLGAAVEFLEGDWYAPVAGRRFAMIVANPPYIAADDPHLSGDGLPFEPRQALVGGADGLACLARVIADAPAHLHPGGWLLLEHGHDQGATCRNLLAAAGFQDPFTQPDLSGSDRVSGAHL